MPADSGELEFYSGRVFIPSPLLPLASQAFTSARLHPLPRDRFAILKLSGGSGPIGGRFVEVAGTSADVSSLPEILAGLGLPPDIFASVAWGIFDSLPNPLRSSP